MSITTVKKFFVNVLYVSRAVLFNIFLILHSVIWSALFVLPSFFSEKCARIYCYTFSAISLLGLKYICGITYRIEGEVPKEPCIIAPMHQSMVECLIFNVVLNYPKFIVKRELLWEIPNGYFCILLKYIVINRNSGTKALRATVDGVVNSVADGRSVVIFPQGTRSKFGEIIKCKTGINLIYKEEIAEIYPVILDSGKFWPKKSFLKFPGVITIRFLPPVSQDMNYKHFNEFLDNLFESQKI